MIKVYYKWKLIDEFKDLVIKQYNRYIKSLYVL